MADYWEALRKLRVLAADMKQQLETGIHQPDRDYEQVVAAVEELNETLLTPRVVEAEKAAYAALHSETGVPLFEFGHETTPTKAELEGMARDLVQAIDPTLRWRKGDPRLSVNKCADIVIVRPVFGAGLGTVETKNGWRIQTSFEDHWAIGADDKWDEDWWWAFGPQEK